MGGVARISGVVSLLSLLARGGRGLYTHMKTLESVILNGCTVTPAILRESQGVGAWPGGHSSRC
jgi:hypothetical protein